ncbi:hypothetical protein EF513_02315 [Rickettsiales endosymbiont of Stachyamoeba lipophora]|nr:hypothetical protein EF513_02315 [Rickettsiales endosymbiont of Stachyamoeba lipophora]
MEENILLLKAIFGLVFIIALIVLIWALMKKNFTHLLNRMGPNTDLKVHHFISLPNRSQLLHISSKQFNKDYLLIVQTNGETKLIDQKPNEHK